MTRCNEQQPTGRRTKKKTTPPAPPSPWLTAEQAGPYAQVGIKTLYKEVHEGRLRAAVVGGRRSLRFRTEWIDSWLTATSEPREITRR